MSELPRPPVGQVLDPSLYAAARARWPDSPVTTQMLHDAAALAGRSPFVAGNPQATAALAIELREEQRRIDSAAAIKRAYRAMGFDPNKNYRATEEA